MEHSFQIITIRQIEAYFGLNLQYKHTGDKPIEIKHNIEIASELKAKTLHVRVSISSDGAKQPFRFNVVVEGIFLFKDDIAKDDLERLAHINCAAIIFPNIRESVADLTRRAHIPPFHLSPVNFVNLHAQRRASVAKAVKKKIAPKKVALKKAAPRKKALKKKA